MNGISALIRDPRRGPLPLLPCEVTLRRQPFMNQELGNLVPSRFWIS